ncbi:pyridoxamine 5'-phosphate oxidase family protein [Brevibacillus daliensis]|uniref:pyridoxamine 5'-phosphate oxidase family protein n=1 Tax=Brevibacillus daliensis TaxID=2892995 RepID=UPI002814E425|nr:pyridoxamine 5'-phosphate oxidase family protein [Brevibacillus daliensis]
MFQIRRQMNECKDQEKIECFIEKAKVGYLGLSDFGKPYVVPLNFAWVGGAIYFHGATVGRKAEIILQNEQVCFTICEDLGTMSDPIPAHVDTAYFSVMLFGTIAPVKELDEATLVLQAMLDKYVPGYFNRALPKKHVQEYQSSLEVMYRYIELMWNN